MIWIEAPVGPVYFTAEHTSEKYNGYAFKKFFLVGGFHNIKFQGYLFCTGETLNALATGECSSEWSGDRRMLNAPATGESANAPGVHSNGETGFGNCIRTAQNGFSKLYRGQERVFKTVSRGSRPRLSPPRPRLLKPLAANRTLHDSNECSTTPAKAPANAPRLHISRRWLTTDDLIG